jgi:hypothetical protein
MKASELTSARGKASLYSYDPRPEKFRHRAGAQDIVSNACINFQVRVKDIDTLAINQMF